MENDPFETQMDAARMVGTTVVKTVAVLATVVAGVLLYRRVVAKRAAKEVTTESN